MEVGLVKAGLAAAGALLLGADVLRGRRAHGRSRLIDAGLALLGALAAACWWNLGLFNYPTFGHPSETYHYYLGAKYPELGYTNLYRCTAVAEAESGRRAAVEQRAARHLGTNRIVSGAELLRDPEACKTRFTAERWQAFRRDLRFFRRQLRGPRWERSQLDHGYNATPAWGLLGAPLARAGPATERQILLLQLLDPLLLGLTGLAVWWAFGWRTLCVVLVYWGTNYPAQYGWVGGGYLRQVEFAALFIGICCLRRARPAAGGALLAMASLVRIFPVAAFAGVGLRALWEAVDARRLTLSREHRRLALAALATAAIAVPLSSIAAGRPSAWMEFAENSRVLLGTPLRNHVGLGTLVAWDPSATSRALLDPSLADPFEPWKRAREHRAGRRRWLFLAGVAGFAALLAAAVRRSEDWVATVLALGLVPIAFELTCYYWALLAAYALLWQRHPSIGAALCALSAAGWWIASPTHWYDELFYDETFTGISLATVVFVSFATVRCLLPSRPGPGSDLAGARSG